MSMWNNCFVISKGTCINNTSVMMFKKGSFEISCTVYPVAIKVRTASFFCYVLALLFIKCFKFLWLLFWQYDPRFGDAFWNSSKFGMVNYLLHMMSSWAIVCSVWYLPPMSRMVSGEASKETYVLLYIHTALQKFGVSKIF